MAFEKLTGIIIRYTDYKENDRILTLLTKERGVVSVNARGVRTAKSASSGSAGDVYCYGEFVVYERNRISYVSSSTVLEAFYPLREDYDKLVAAAQIARLTEKVPQGQINEELFSLVYHSLSFLAYGSAEPADILIAFAAKFTVIEGYEPVITCCASCGASVLSLKNIGFSNAQGGALCAECAEGEPRYDAYILEALRRLLRLEPEGMDRVRIKEDMRAKLHGLVFDYIEYCMEQPVRLKGGLKTLGKPQLNRQM